MARSTVALDVKIPSDVRYIDEVIELATRKCRELHLPPHKCSLNVRVALAEAISNAILRGNGDDPAKNVHVRAEVDTRRLIVEVGDEGVGFDLDMSERDPTKPENLNREDGRGLYLMRKLMDRVEMVEVPRGSMVRMTLNRE